LKTLRGRGSSKLIIKKSVFIGYAAPVYTEDEAADFLAEVRGYHEDARHHAFAYLINDGRNFAVKYDDAGEPKGSAGKPILKVIQNRGLSNVVVVVTRYFGGIKLGYGGLVKAYSEAASLAIDNAGVVEVRETERFKVTLPYDLFYVVRETLESAGTKIIDEDYGRSVELTVEIAKDETGDLIELLRERTRGRIRVERSSWGEPES